MWLRGESGGRCLLGTLVPEGGKLRLSRTLTRQGLVQCGCWPISGGETVLAFPFTGGKGDGGDWSPLPPGRTRLSDSVLDSCVRESRALLYREHRGGFQLAAPFDVEHPLALAPLFCLGRLESIQGQPHLIWSFDGRGNPILPYNDSSFGTR